MVSACSHMHVASSGGQCRTAAPTCSHARASASICCREEASPSLSAQGGCCWRRRCCCCVSWVMSSCSSRRPAPCAHPAALCRCVRPAAAGVSNNASPTAGACCNLPWPAAAAAAGKAGGLGCACVPPACGRTARLAACVMASSGVPCIAGLGMGREAGVAAGSCAATAAGNGWPCMAAAASGCSTTTASCSAAMAANCCRTKSTAGHRGLGARGGSGGGAGMPLGPQRAVSSCHMGARLSTMQTSGPASARGRRTSCVGQHSEQGSRASAQAEAAGRPQMQRGALWPPPACRPPAGGSECAPRLHPTPAGRCSAGVAPGHPHAGRRRLQPLRRCRPTASCWVCCWRSTAACTGSGCCQGCLRCPALPPLQCPRGAGSPPQAQSPPQGAAWPSRGAAA